MRLLAALAAAGTAGLGCNTAPKLDTEVDVFGLHAEVTVFGVKAGDVVTIGTQTERAERPGAVRKKVLVDQVAAAGNKVEVSLTRDGKTTKGSVAVELAERDLEPMLELGDCVREPKGEDVGDGDRRQSASFTISSDAWYQKRRGLGSEELCGLAKDGRLHVWVTAHSDAQVTIGGTPVPLTDGRADFGIDVGALVTDLTLAELASDEKRNSELVLTFDAAVTRAGQSRSYPVKLRGLRESPLVALHRAFTSWNGKGPWPWARSEHAGAPRAAVLVTQNAEVEVDGKTQRTMGGWYAFPRVVGDAFKTNEVDLVAIATPIDVKKAGSCKGYTTVSGSGPVRNVLWKHGLDVTIYDPRGTAVAQKRFAASTSDLCPEAIATYNDKTVLVLVGPEDKPVLEWIDSVRKQAR